MASSISQRASSISSSEPSHIVLPSAVAVLLGLLLYIVFCFDHPFGTQLATGASPQPDEACLSVALVGGSGRGGLDRDRETGPVYEPS
jgi:hypothetical protein